LPIYEYECEQCKNRVEVLQKLSDPPIETCSSCGGKVHKMVSSPAGLVFKGSGWYITDYAKKNGKSDSTPNTKGEGKSDASTSGKGETTPKETAPKPNPPPSNPTS
jgi:putative FmdB family regulatory protein